MNVILCKIRCQMSEGNFLQSSTDHTCHDDDPALGGLPLALGNPLDGIQKDLSFYSIFNGVAVPEEETEGIGHGSVLPQKQASRNALDRLFPLLQHLQNLLRHEALRVGRGDIRIGSRLHRFPLQGFPGGCRDEGDACTGVT